jgi:hypothetical protein
MPAALVVTRQKVADRHPGPAGPVKKHRIAGLHFRLHGIAAKGRLKVFSGNWTAQLPRVDEDNRGTPFTGLPTLVDVTYYQSAFINTMSGSGPSGILSLVGWDGVAVGYYIKNTSDNTYTEVGVSGEARYLNSNTVGLHTATMFIAKANGSGSTVWGAAPNPPWPLPNINSEMLISYRG